MEFCMLEQRAWPWVTLVILFGLSVGSFLNVVIYRLPRKMSLLRPSSRCPGCERSLSWYENIPILSYIVLRGKCRVCESSISWRYPLVEAVSGGLFILFWLMYGPSITTLGFWFFSSALVVAFFIDMEHRIIPDVVTLPGIVIGVLFAFVSPHLQWSDSLIGVGVGGGSFLAAAYLGDWLFKKQSMGGGDIKLAGMIGAFLGWQKVVLMFMLSAGIGLIVSSVVLFVSQKFRRTRILPFGPFMALAAMIAVLYGQTLIDFYISNFWPH